MCKIMQVIVQHNLDNVSFFLQILRKEKCGAFAVKSESQLAQLPEICHADINATYRCLQYTQYSKGKGRHKWQCLQLVHMGHLERNLYGFLSTFYSFICIC